MSGCVSLSSALLMSGCVSLSSVLLMSGCVSLSSASLMSGRVLSLGVQLGQHPLHLQQQLITVLIRPVVELRPLTLAVCRGWCAGGR